MNEAQTAQRLDPRSPSIKAATEHCLFRRRRPESREALAECDKALAINDGFVPALKVKRWVYAVIGDRSAAQEVFQKEVSYSGGRLTEPGWQIVGLQLVAPGDNNAQNLKSALDAAVKDSSAVSGNDYTFSFEIALAYNNLGATDKALEWLRNEAALSNSTQLQLHRRRTPASPTSATLPRFPAPRSEI